MGVYDGPRYDLDEDHKVIELEPYDWKQVLERDLVKLYPDMHVRMVSEGKEELELEMSFIGRPQNTEELYERLVQYLRGLQPVSIRSLNVELTK